MAVRRGGIELFVGLAALVALLGGFFFIVELPKPAPDVAKLTDLELLGEHLFDDSNLSEPKGLACVACHDPFKARQGNNGSRLAAVARGSRPEIFGNRNTPTIMYSMFSPPFAFVKVVGENGRVEHVPTGGQFWDGRAATLAEQARGPFLNPLEMNNPSVEAVVAKVRASKYAHLMRKVFGADAFSDSEVAFANISEAIAAYQKLPEFIPFASRFDAYLRGEILFTEIETRGFELFKDPQKGNCLACHVGKADSRKPEDWLFTDFTYDSAGVPRNSAIPVNADAGHYDLGLCKQPGIEKKAPAGFNIASLCGFFKVPTLRNIAQTAPYFHNGSIVELRDVVKFYATRDTNPEIWFTKLADGSVKKYDDLPPESQIYVNADEVPYDRKRSGVPRLNDEEIDAIVAFLKTLSDPSVD